MITSRRSFIAGIAAAFAAPAIVRASSLMPVTGGVITHPVLLRSGMSLLTINQITRESIKLFRNSNAFLQHLDREYEKDMAFIDGPQWEKLIYNKERRTIERVIIPLNEVYQL